LGEGQYSIVYLGSYTLKNSLVEFPCAIKQAYTNPEAQKLAVYESFLLSQLSHPSIINLVSVEDDLGMDTLQVQKQYEECVKTGYVNPSIRILLALEYCPNNNMWEWMQKHSSKIGSKLWIKWANEIASGIQAIHAFGIIHHDIKPHNILVCVMLM
jgi:serine/threonine protein kinase